MRLFCRSDGLYRHTDMNRPQQMTEEGATHNGADPKNDHGRREREPCEHAYNANAARHLSRGNDPGHAEGAPQDARVPLQDRQQVS
jgi:hypothetical protein